MDDETAREIERLVRKLDQRFRMETVGDVCPSQKAVTICRKDEEIFPRYMYWGFPGSGRKGLLINARAETVSERKMFCDNFQYWRCIIPARGFYEWNARREKYWFEREDTGLLFMAGLYQIAEGRNRFVILTTQANQSVRPVHDRMPLILEETEIQGWIQDDRMADHLRRKIPVELKRGTAYEQMRLF